MECSVRIIAPRNLTSVSPDFMMMLQVCSSCGREAGVPSIYVNDQLVHTTELSQMAGGMFGCDMLFEARLQFGLGIYQIQAAMQHDEEIAQPITIIVRPNMMKRFLYLLHTSSLWKLGDLQRDLISLDSDVITLVCPPPMSADEENAYKAEEEIATYSFESCNFQSNECSRSKFGTIYWHRNCDYSDAELLLYTLTRHLLPYSFYIYVQDDNLLSLAHLFDGNYVRPDHRTFMSYFSKFSMDSRLMSVAHKMQPTIHPSFVKAGEAERGARAVNGNARYVLQQHKGNVPSPSFPVAGGSVSYTSSLPALPWLQQGLKTPSRARTRTRCHA